MLRRQKRMKKVKLELAVVIVMLYEIEGEVGELTWKWFRGGEE
jgi:hypothetical protein